MDSNNPHQHHDSSSSPSSPLPIQSSSSSAMTHSLPFSSSSSPSPTPIQSSMATAQSSPISMPSTTTTAIPHSSSSSPSPAPVQPYCTACSSPVTSMAVIPLVSQPSTSTHDSMPGTAIVMKAPDTNVAMPCTSGERAQSATQSMPETAKEPRKNDPPIPVGYRLVGNCLVFNPTDEELIQHLANKLKRESVPAIFEELDVFSFHPDDLMGKNTELYFFTEVERWNGLSRDIKYGLGTFKYGPFKYGLGTWKQDESIEVKSSDAVIGIKAILEFREENIVHIPSLTHTFHMDEFRMIGGVDERVTVLCRIVKKKV